MGKFFFGLLTGIILCAIAAFIALPTVKKESYDIGYAEGNKKGMADGKTAGIAEGVAEMKAQLEFKHKQDSAAAANRYKAAKYKAETARRKAEEKPKPVQNWHVINGQIDDPITQ